MEHVDSTTYIHGQGTPRQIQTVQLSTVILTEHNQGQHSAVQQQQPRVVVDKLSTVECSNAATTKWVACGNHVCVFVLLYFTEHGEQIQQGFPRPLLVLYRHSKSAHKTSGLVWPPVGPANTVAGLSCLRRQPHCDQRCVKWTLLVCGQCEINVLSQGMLCEPVHTSSTVHRTYIRIYLRCIKISASTEVSSDVKSKLQHVQMHMLQ